MLATYAVEVRMDQRNVVIADDAIAEGRQALLHALDLNTLRKRIADMEEFLVGCGVWQEQALAVSYILQPEKSERIIAQ
jgi:hypothetical protein